MKPKAILISTDFRAQFEMLNDKEAGELIKALFRYAEEGTPLETKSKAVRVLFGLIRAQLDKDAEKYAKICEKRKKAVEARWKKTEQTEQMNTNEYKCIQMYTNEYKSIQVDSNINNNNNNNTSSPLTAPAHACEDALDREAAEMLSSPVWLDNMMAKYNLTREQIAEKVEAFKLDCRCRGVTGHDTQKDAFQHFNNWLIKTLNQQILDETTTGNAGRTREDARRSEREQRLHEYAAVAAKFRAESEADLASRGGA